MYFLDKIKPVFNWDCGFFDYYQLQNSGAETFKAAAKNELEDDCDDKTKEFDFKDFE